VPTTQSPSNRSPTRIKSAALDSQHFGSYRRTIGTSIPVDALFPGPRSNVAELVEDPPERTGNQLQKERYYRKRLGAL
jgi:hypothetical protein